MAKYIQRKDGKMAGSIGDGKTNVPASAPQLPPRPPISPVAAFADLLASDELYESVKELFGEEQADATRAMYPQINAIVGRTVSTVHWSQRAVTFETDGGLITFQVEGDCCSDSYFHDLIGLQKLLSNGPVTAIESINLGPGDPGHTHPAPHDDPEAQAIIDALSQPVEDDYDVIQVYGYRITTEHPQWGPQSTVLAFRNASNGYYGGWMTAVKGEIRADMRPLTSDVIGD